MKFLHAFYNYLKFVLKQGSTSWLILLYPIILIGLIGIGLNIDSSNKIPVAVYGDDPVIQSLGNDGSLLIIPASSVESVQSLVKGKHAVAGIAISSTDSRKRIDVYLDSTKHAVVSNLLLTIDKAVNEEKMKSGTSLKSIQQQLAPILVKLKQKRTEISSLSSELSDLRQNISLVKNELVQGRSKLQQYRTDLTSYRSNLSALDAYAAKLDDYDSRLGILYNSVSDKENERNSVVYRLSTNIAKIDGYIAKVNNAYNYVIMARSYVPYGSSAYNYLIQTENELLSVRSDLYNAKYDMESTRSELEAIDFNSIRTSVSSVRDDLVTTRSDLSDFKYAADVRISSMLVDVGAADTKLALGIDALDAFDSRIVTLQSKADEANNLIGATIGPLQEFLGKKPEELLPPEIVSTNVFGDAEGRMDLFFPAILGIDMLLASLLLPMIMKVRMREQGVELRLIRSKASSISIILGELLANYTIAFFQLFIICLCGILFFGIHINNPIGFMAVFITLPLVFTSLGVFLSQLINRSTTAFLLSLLIGIPLIFISGTIIPIEFLHPLIATLGKILPLYVVIDFAEKLLFRGADLVDVLINYVYLVLFTSFSILAAIVAYAVKR